MNGTALLKGIRVVEFSHMVMGPSCGLVLADLGADVIKVEPAGRGDNTRRLAGSGAGFFASFNRNKRSIAVDLKSERGRALASRLISTADVMTENFRPGALEALGFGYESLAATNPRLIHCSLKGFLSGPYENRAALDEVVQMLAGLAYMTGPPGKPLRAGASVNDIMGGMFAVIGILAALNERNATGKGRSIKAGLFENCVYLMSTHMMQFAVTGKPAAPMPQRLAAWAVYDVFDVADGSQVFVGVVSDTQWLAFCAAFGLGDLLEDPNLGSNRDRVLSRDRFMPRVRAMFADMPRAEVLSRCDEIGLPFAPINRPEDMFADPHLNHPGAMLPLTLPSSGEPARAPALPLEIDGERPGLYRDLPLAGEHSAEICRELGLSETEVVALLADGLITTEAAQHSEQ
ncbi:CaiB Predicted acyl-CoA transferases/carnitine dehydratase [Rhabdaerophilaceae bacterium]